MTDNIIFRFLTRLCDLFLLNVMWIVCSLPIVTIGASTTALYAVTLKMARNEEGYIIKSFFKAFKENFKQSTPIWLLLAVLSGLLAFNFCLTLKAEIPFAFAIQVISGLIGLLLLFELLYVFPMTARYENTTGNMLKNALLLSIVRLPYTMLISVITLGTVVLTFWTTKTFAIASGLWLVIGVSALAYVNSIFLRKAFRVLESQE